MEIYTSAEEAGELIHKRWEDKALKEAVEAKLKGDIPDLLRVEPSGMLFRQIATPDGEFSRFVELNKVTGTKPVCFEYLEDKFVAGNFTKMGLGRMPFSQGKNKDGHTIVLKERIIDFNEAGGKKLKDVRTLWGETLSDFHHAFLLQAFPELKGRALDMSGWFARNGGTPRKYYYYLFLLALAHYIQFDDYDLLESEDSFIGEVVLPAFEEVRAEFNLKPLVVKISRVGEHAADPYWWSYPQELKEVADRHIVNYQNA